MHKRLKNQSQGSTSMISFMMVYDFAESFAAKSTMVLYHNWNLISITVGHGQRLPDATDSAEKRYFTRERTES